MDHGEDAIHTIDLPEKNLTDDFDIISLSMKEQRIVISKDRDFYEHYILKDQPFKLLWITTGNMGNKDMIALFQRNYFLLKKLLEEKIVIELNKTDIIVHY